MFLLSALFCIPYWLKFEYSIEFGLHETEIGKNPQFNRIVHFWMYLPVVYIIPFTILIVTNFYLICTIMLARRRRQRLGMTSSLTNTQNQQSSMCKEMDEMTKLNNGSGNENVLVSKKASIKKRTSQYNESTRKRQQNQRVGGMNITIMLIAVVCLFFCCQFPVLILHIFQSMYCSDNRHLCNTSPLFLYSTQASKFLLICNLSLNFACYCLFSKKFRLVLKETICISKDSSTVPINR